MSKEKKENPILNVISQVATIPALVIVILYLFISFALPEVVVLFGKEPLPNMLYYTIVVSACCGVILIISPFIIIINYKRERDEQTEKLIEITDSITERLNIAGNHVENILTSSIIQEARIIQNENEFFRELEIERDNVEGGTIRLMNFAKTIQEQKRDKNAKKYYDDEINFYLNHDTNNESVKIYKIVSIQTKEKFKDCWHLAEMAEKRGVKNFNLAYVYIENNGDRSLPKITGVQIIGDVVMIMDPTVARIDSDHHKDTIFIRSKKIADIYSNYSKALWNEISDYHESKQNEPITIEENQGYIGYILYSGKQKKLSENQIWKNINNVMPQGEKLDDKDLAKMGIK